MSSIEVRSANLDQLDVGKLGAKWSARGDRILRYYIDFRHKALNLHKEVSAPELFILQSKVDALMASWDEKHAALRVKRLFQSGAQTAADLEAQELERRSQYQLLLKHTLKIDDRVDWDSLKDWSEFNRDSFQTPKPALSLEPRPSFQEPTIGFFDKVFGKATRLVAAAEEKHDYDLANWEAECSKRQEAHFKDVALWEKKKAAFVAEQDRLEREFKEAQAGRNAGIDELQNGVASGQVGSVLEHATLVLENSDYQGLVEKSFNVDYQPETKTVMVEYYLPTLDKVPSVKSVRFVKATGELKEASISERESKTLHENACYQIALRRQLYTLLHRVRVAT